MRARRPRRPLTPPAWLLLVMAAAAGLSACLPVSRPLIKLGLVAPFEGRYRDLGYEVIYAVRLAVREANAAGGAGGYSLALMAYDDSGDADQAAEQARKAASDPDVLGVIGHWLPATTQAAAAVYAEAGLPLLAPNTGSEAPGLPDAVYRLGLPAATELAALPAGAEVCPAPCDALDDLTWLLNARAQHPGGALVGPALWGEAQFLALAGPAAEGTYFITAAPYPADSTDPAFAERYAAISNGVVPRANAVLAYDATRLLIEAIGAAADEQVTPNRAGVDAALAVTALDGLSGTLGFDADRRWVTAEAWVYQWQAGTAVLVR
jgi:ABC-type branched-subunit amino acid transport system substrate-binding protein